ncbi:MAG: fumarylacetoacetate hydrolase family protein [Hyphomicrobiales bacterium]|nr:fumarylacetoacetate hydrolase family protein [Hyphomicrobiales bacterium]
MKLATLDNGSRDGCLVVVTRDLSRCAAADAIALNLQAALDGWHEARPALEALADKLERGAIAGATFDQATARSPLPRAYQWADGSAYVNHVALVRQARGAEMPPAFWTDPLIYQGGSDTFLGPHQPITLASEDYGIDMEGEIAVITGDVPMAASRGQAESEIRLVMLANDVSLRNLIPAELAKGFGFFQSKPSTAFSPVAVTPDELGANWDGARLHLPLLVDLNGVPFGRPEAGIDMTFGFPDLIVHAARTRALGAGTIIGSGTISNRGPDGGPGRTLAEGGVGYSCLAELRTIETIKYGAPRTPFMHFGDEVRLEMLDRAGNSIFGSIRQKVARLI